MSTRKPDPPRGGANYPEDFPKIDDSSVDRVLNRADALARAQPQPRSARPGRIRARGAARPAAADADFPVLTEVVAGPPKPPTAQDLMLDQIENELRLELLDQLGPELERLIESRVHARLEASVAEVMAGTRDQLVSEVRRAVREVARTGDRRRDQAVAQHARRETVDRGDGAHPPVPL